MEKLILVNHTDELTRVAILEEGNVGEVHLESDAERRIVGNIYKGKVMRVLPGMNAAFVDVGLERTAFLYALDVINARKPEDSEKGNEETGGAHNSEKDRVTVRIETLLREGQELLVQVSKEPIGSKGARLTCNVTLPGVLVVLMPTVDHVGVSRRIEDPEERERLKGIGELIKPPGAGIIMRTVAEGRDELSLKKDVDFLYGLWQQLLSGADAVSPPALVHEDLSLMFRSARDLICRDFDRLLIDSESGSRQLKSFVQRLLPQFSERIEVYKNPVPLFDRYGVDTEIARALQRRVWLKSGGSIVIDRTEALTSIDVNTGKYTGKSDPEETILRNNMEAAREIAYQLRLRNIGGIIVIDFIDMRDLEHREQVRNALVEELQKDHARTRVLPMSDLGLVEMTRKRVTESIVSKLTEPCFYCEGKGYLQTPDMVCHRLLAKVKKEMVHSRAKTIHVHANPKVVQVLMELYGNALERLELRHMREIVLTERDGFHLERYEVFGEV